MRSKLAASLAVVAMGIVLVPIFLFDGKWPTEPRDYLERNGEYDSDAKNLVSAIYLGYRAFDTLGETLVLLVAVSGTISILRSVKMNDRAEENLFILPEEKPVRHRLRTHLLEVVTGKIGPVVLLFGFYVMVFGHLSPGGGFQGGVVIASGIVFIALGSGSDTALTRPTTLGRIEAGTFLIVLIASMSGSFIGLGYFSDPFLGSDSFPAAFIVFLNSVIGLKVGAGIGLLCVATLGKEE